MKFSNSILFCTTHHANHWVFCPKIEKDFSVLSHYYYHHTVLRLHGIMMDRILSYAQLNRAYRYNLYKFISKKRNYETSKHSKTYLCLSYKNEINIENIIAL